METVLGSFDDQKYLKDCDATKDIGRTSDKKETVTKLLELDDFYMQGCGAIKDPNAYTFIILDKDKSADKGVVTFVETKGGKIISRCKLYNKAYDQFCNPGNHIHDFIACTDGRLKEAFNNPLAKTRGIARLEITLYNNEMASTKEMDNLIIRLYWILDADLYYHVPISKLWTNIAEHIIYNLIVIKRKVRLLYIVYYVNLHTQK